MKWTAGESVEKLQLVVFYLAVERLLLVASWEEGESGGVVASL